MKNLLFASILSIISYTQAGIVPASTTLIRQSTSIAHPSAALAYSQPFRPVALSYSAPLAYAHQPAIYSQHLLAPAHYASPLFSQTIFGQYPGLIGQSPVLAQYPSVAQGPIQVPVQGGGGSPTIEAADGSQSFPPQQQPLPQAPPQPSPIQSGPSGGTTFDDDTVSVEAA